MRDPWVSMIHGSESNIAWQFRTETESLLKSSDGLPFIVVFFNVWSGRRCELGATVAKYEVELSSWNFHLVVGHCVTKLEAVNRTFRHYVVWSWKSMYTKIGVAMRSWMLFANIECWHTTWRRLYAIPLDQQGPFETKFPLAFLWPLK